MTPTELRALADALEPLASLERSGSQGALALESTIAYLRAQADAQPVAWIAHNLTTGHVKWTTDRCRARGWTRSVNLRVKPLYAHPAPAAPQAEPKREPNPDEVICPACNHQFRAIPENVQAQLWAKREPLSDDAISYEHACRSSYESACAASDFDSFKLGVRFAERAHKIGGSDAGTD